MKEDLINLMETCISISRTCKTLSKEDIVILLKISQKIDEIKSCSPDIWKTISMRMRRQYRKELRKCLK